VKLDMKGETYIDFFYKKNSYFVGSASTALYIYIKHKKLYKEKILIPSNICHSIPLSIVYSGNIPFFYDVNKVTGNPCIDSIKYVVSKDKVAAVVIPNMFGNVLGDRCLIIDFLKFNNVLIIDDCAASLGADMGYLLTSGDAAIFSFGENKHIDLNVGGVLATNEVVDVLDINKEIKNTYETSQYKVNLFNSIYKPIFYSDYYYQVLPLINKVVDFFNDCYVFRYEWDEDKINELDKELNLLNKNKTLSLKKIKYLDEKINFNSFVYERYEFSSGSNPWRYNILINDVNAKEKLIMRCLNESIAISKWYPPIEPLFGSSPQEGAVEFSKRVVNFNHMNLCWKKLDMIIDILNAIGDEFDK